MFIKFINISVCEENTKGIINIYLNSFIIYQKETTERGLTAKLNKLTN